MNFAQLSERDRAFAVRMVQEFLSGEGQHHLEFRTSSRKECTTANLEKIDRAMWDALFLSFLIAPFFSGGVCA